MTHELSSRTYVTQSHEEALYSCTVYMTTELTFENFCVLYSIRRARQKFWKVCTLLECNMISRPYSTQRKILSLLSRLSAPTRVRDSLMWFVKFSVWKCNCRLESNTMKAVLYEMYCIQSTLESHNISITNTLWVTNSRVTHNDGTIWVTNSRVTHYDGTVRNVLYKTSIDPTFENFCPQHHPSGAQGTHSQKAACYWMYRIKWV